MRTATALSLTMGTPAPARRRFLSRSAVSGSAGAVLPLDGTLEAEIFRDKDLKRCAVCGGVFVPKSNRAKYCPGCAARVHRRQKTESEREKEACCGQLGSEKSLDLSGFASPKPGQVV